MKDVKLTYKKKPFEAADGKRFYVPGAKITAKCDCGKKITHDLGTEYLSYPWMNDAAKVTLYCRECSNEFPVFMQVDLSLKLVPDPEA